MRGRHWLLAGAVGTALGVAIWRHCKKRSGTMWTIGDSVSDVAEAHLQYLRLNYPGHKAKFQKLLNRDREAAFGEAAVFALLRTYFRARPEPHDDPGTGGVDFVCRRGAADEFVVEVTSLQPEAVARSSGIPASVDEWGGAFKMTTAQLFHTVCGKADQLADYPCPRVLAITSTHHASSFLLGPDGAEYLLASEPGLTYVPHRPVTTTTNLQNSVFFRGDGRGQIVPCRCSVSALLLISLFDDGSRVTGLLHPQPTHPLSIERFPEVPFLRIADWPIERGRIRMEWVIASPQAKNFPNFVIKATADTCTAG